MYDDATTEPVSCYLGLIKSYYDIDRDDYPMLIKGSRYQYYSWTYNENCYMHNCTTSGVQSHENFSWANTLAYDRGTRNGNNIIMLPTITVNTNASNTEMRGEPYGVYQINGARVPVFGAISTASGVFLTFKFDQNVNYTHAFGPVSSGIEGFNMWEGGSSWVDGVQIS